MTAPEGDVAALADTLQGMDFSTFGCGNPWKHRAAQLLRSNWLKQRDERIKTEAVAYYLEHGQSHVIAEAVNAERVRIAAEIEALTPPSGIAAQTRLGYMAAIDEAVHVASGGAA